MIDNLTTLTPLEVKSAIVREPLTMFPDQLVFDALIQMSNLRSVCNSTRIANGKIDDIHREARASCVVVVEDSQVIGIVTERDLVRLSAQQRELEGLTIREVMSHPVVTLPESALTDLFLAINLLKQYNIRHVPILNGQNHLVGIITHESLRQISRPIDLLRLRLVQEVMTHKVVCAEPDSSMLLIAQLMLESKVSSVVIVEASCSLSQPCKIPLGIISERDLVQFQALGLKLENYRAKTAMSTPLFTIDLEDSLWKVQEIMEQHFIRRLVVTGKQGELLGIITQTSLLQALNPIELYNLAEVLKKKVLRLEAEKIAVLLNRNVELERQVEIRTAALKAKAKREKLLADLGMQIRSSLNLQMILETTAKEVRQVLGCDCVNIWQFNAHQQSILVAEATDSPVSLIGEQIDDICFQENMVKIYRQGRVLIVSDIYKTEILNCQRKMLNRLQTRANILVPLLCDNDLWGFIHVSESKYSRNWKQDEVELLKSLSVQLGIALKQAINYQELEAELKERKQAEAKLRESEQLYESLTQAVPVGIFRTNAVGSCIYVNQQWCEIAGLTPEEASGEGWQQSIHPEDRDLVTTEWENSVLENRPFHLEYRFQRPDGMVIWVYGQGIAERDSNGQLISYVGTITNISDRKQAEQNLEILNQQLEQRIADRTAHLQSAMEQLQVEIMQRTTLEENLRVANQELEKLSQTDGLTQIANRRQFDRELHKKSLICQRNQQSLSLILFDVDYFKLYNDFYGHQMGDNCLFQIAQVSQQTISRPSDLVARYGGEEFTIILPNTDCAGAVIIAQRLQSKIAALAIPHEHSKISDFVTVSMGIASLIPSVERSPTESEQLLPETLISHADRVLYQAKQQGRNRYVVFPNFPK